MSHSENPNQEPLNFLKSVVDQGSGQGQSNKNGTDSDKENENRDFVTSTTKEFSFSLSSETPATNNENRTMSKEDNDMWDDFYNEEEFEDLKNEGKSDNNDFDILRPESRRLDKVEEEEEDDYVDESNATDTIESRNTKDSGSNKHDYDDRDGDGGSDINNTTSSKRKRRKRLFKRRNPPPLSPQSRTLLPIGGSHPNLSGHNRYNRNDSFSSDQNSNQLETMSETSGGERKLSRRKQVSRPRCAGPKPNGDRLEQKYQELEHLMLKPLPNPGVYVQQTRQKMQRLHGLSTQNHNLSHRLEPPMGRPPTGQQQQPIPRDMEKVDRVIQVIEEDTNQVYSTIRTVQANNISNRPKSAHPRRRRPLSGQRQLKPRPQSADKARPSTSYNHGSSEHSSSVLSNVNLNLNHSYSNSSNNNNINSRGRRAKGRGEAYRKAGRSDSSASGGSHKRSDRSESGSKDRDYASSFEDGTGSRSASRSPGRAIQTTDNHLKNSSNPALKQWLKTKDKEYRQQKREERKKKSRERAEKQEEEQQKQEHLKKAEEKVKQWMSQKRKEAWRQEREERKRQKAEEKEIEEQIRHTESLRGKMFTPIKRPPGKYEGENNNASQQQQQDTNHATTTPQPPKSKFVYKRPVSGRVRLMKLQQERKEDTKKMEEKKKEMDEILAKDNERKMRMSYDQWLLKKREDDYSKRREAAKQRALAKSDPELDRLVPEMARRRIAKIKRGKKRIDTGDHSLDRSVNKSFGGGDFEEEEKAASPSYRLEVSGDKKSLKQRPSSAKNASSFNPQKSKSPRRPQSANPRVQALMDEGEDASLNPDNAFKLPFAPELGIPKYVAAKQEKLFSQEVISSANASMDDGSARDDLNVDGGAVQKKTLSEDNQTDNGQDHVDAEAEFIPGMKVVADAVIASNIIGDEEKKKEDDQSFFVTDGNIEKDGDATENALNENDEGVYDQEEDNAEKQEKEKSEKEASNSECENTDMDNSDFFYDQRKDGSSGKDNGVPPLDIADDDASEVKYEEEKDETEEENMDSTGKEGDEKSGGDSSLLSNVDDVSDSLEVKSSIKHVSFSEEATVHMDPLAGISMNDDDYFFDYDERTETDQNGDDEGEEQNGDPLSVSDNFDYETLDDIEGYQEEEDEAEDERGGYFDNETPRDDTF